jgi:hypothetical protein
LIQKKGKEAFDRHFENDYYIIITQTTIYISFSWKSIVSVPDFDF